MLRLIAILVLTAVVLRPLAARSIPASLPDLESGTYEVVWDFDGDGREDHGVLVDEREGLFESSASLTMYLADGTVVADWKQGQWKLDVLAYPGIDPRTVAGSTFTKYMRDRDERIL